MKLISFLCCCFIGLVDRLCRDSLNQGKNKTKHQSKGS